MPLGYGKLFKRPTVNWMYQSEPEPRTERPARLHAARQGARRLDLDQRPGLHPRPARGLRRLGQLGCRLGLSTTCCPTSGRPRTRSAARANGTAPAGRSRCPTCASRTSCATPSSLRRRGRHPRNHDFNGATPGRHRLLPGSRRATAGAAARRSAICARREARRNLHVETEALAHARAVRGHARRRRRILRRTGATHEARAAREVILSRRRASTRRSCCSSRASARARCCERHGIPVVHDAPRVGEDLQDHLQVAHRLGAARSRSRSTTRWSNLRGPGGRHATMPSARPAAR